LELKVAPLPTIADSSLSFGLYDDETTMYVATSGATGGTEPYEYTLEGNNEDSFTATKSFDAVENTDYKIVVRDSNGCIGTSSVITPIKEMPSNTNTPSLDETGKVFASNGQLYVSGYPETATLTIYNVQGQILLQRKSIAPITDMNLSSGTYIIKIMYNGKTYTHKIVFE
jgi:hypothetical protein